MGFQTWGTASLDALLKSRHVVPLVITHPESKHEYETIWNDSVKALALSHNIPVIERQYANNKKIGQAISDVKPDMIVLSDWRTWLSPMIYSIPKYGAVNIHDALLPKYGGFAPINWAIINGEIETGVTVHFVSEEFDLGDIVLQRKVPISFFETATDVFYKIIEIIPGLTLEALELVERGKVKFIPQDRNKATFFHKRSGRDSLIDWGRSNIEIYNLIRAQSDPYPNAYTFHKGNRLKIKEASLPDKAYCGTPGRVFCRLKHGVVVVCGVSTENPNQGLIIHLVQEGNGKVVEANDYFNQMGYYLGT